MHITFSEKKSCNRSRPNSPRSHAGTGSSTTSGCTGRISSFITARSRSTRSIPLGSACTPAPRADFSPPAKQRLAALPASLRAGAEAYLLGFVCHFALDSACHGYIEHKIAVSGVTHTEIESEFDRSLLLAQGIEPLSARLTGHIVPSAENAAAIAPFFEGISAKQVQKALRSMLFYNGLLRAPCPPKRFFVNAALRLTGNYKEMHGMMIAKKPVPACADSNLRLLKLMNAAAGECVALAENLSAYLGGTAELSPAFDKTFGAPENWREIPVLPLREEESYEV